MIVHQNRRLTRKDVNCKMNYKIAEILSYFIGLAAVIGLVRIRRIDRAYHPFIILMWAGLLNEIVNTIVIEAGYSNAINDNIYSFVEFTLIVIFLYRTRLILSKRSMLFMLAVNAAAWGIINFLIFSINRFSSYYNIGYSLVTVLLSINIINQLIIHSKSRLIKNPLFLISIAFILLFTYKSLIEIFWIYGLNSSKSFRIEVYRIMTYINLVVNLLFVTAVLWMPKKREFTWL